MLGCFPLSFRPCYIHQLPVEILIKCFPLSYPLEVVDLRLVCRHWKEVIEKNPSYIYKNIAKVTWPHLFKSFPPSIHFLHFVKDQSAAISHIKNNYFSRLTLTEGFSHRISIRGIMNKVVIKKCRPNGRLEAIEIWNLSMRKLEMTIPNQEGLKFKIKDQIMVVWNGTIALIDLTTTRIILKIDDIREQCVRFWLKDQGRLLLIKTSLDKLIAYDLAKKKVVDEISLSSLCIFHMYLRIIRSQCVIYAYCNDYKKLVWNLNQKKIVYKHLPHGNNPITEQVKTETFILRRRRNEHFHFFIRQDKRFRWYTPNYLKGDIVTYCITTDHIVLSYQCGRVCLLNKETLRGISAFFPIDSRGKKCVFRQIFPVFRTEFLAITLNFGYIQLWDLKYQTLIKEVSKNNRVYTVQSLAHFDGKHLVWQQPTNNSENPFKTRILFLDFS